MILENKSKRILLVDDSQVNLDILNEILKDFSRSVALNGKMALKIASKVRPDLILLDIIMPVMDGFEFLENLRADPATKDLPVILITSMQSAEIQEKSKRLNVIGYLEKPFNNEVVRAKVEQAINDTILAN